MSKKNKFELIEALDFESLKSLAITLISKLGYEIKEQTDNYIIANINGPLSSSQHGFVLYDIALTGPLETETIVENIEKFIQKNGSTLVYIWSNFNISKGFQEGLRGKISLNSIEFFGRDQIIELIEINLPDYWKHDDIGLIQYEKDFCDSIVRESELRSLKIFSEKYSKLLDIFIEPKIIHFYEDKETKTPTRKSISIDHILKDTKPCIISGEAGTGKSTLLKKIGEKIIFQNESLDKKNFPVFITVTELFDNQYDIISILNSKIGAYFDVTLEEFYALYNLTILVDSIDELELEHQTKIVKQLDKLFKNYKIKYILGTRSSDKSLTIEGLKNLDAYNIARFSNQQIEQFISKFFINQQSRADKLLDALRENRIIEKLPITPLSLSLISILYEENDLEIPATITDIYENFNSLLLGKAVVSNKIEFIDISFKERILSIYALKLLNTPEKTPMTKKEFFEFFTKYFESKTIPLKKGTLEDVLSYLIENTGVLYLKNNTYVSFNHDSFMEYYAAVEIFKHQRELSSEYVNHFFDLNWQNSAIFYAGHSKDMPSFLAEINSKINSANSFGDFFSAINGAGYLLQALYQTDNKLRKKTVDIVLDVNIRALEFFIKLSSDEKLLFKSFKLPIIWLINLMFFHENFNSGTLRVPLKQAFNDLLEKYKNSPKSTSDGYKALTLALTLYSNRVNEKRELEELIYNSPLLEDNILLIISDLSLNLISNGDIKEMKKEVKKEFKKIPKPMKYLLDTPANKLRFTDYDIIKSKKNVKIVTEGKTDSVILEHAFMTLTNGSAPYWQIKPSGNESGGSHEVFKLLMSSKGLIEKDEFIIGIFDHDDAGLGDYNKLSSSVFETKILNSVKKHKDENIFAVLLPIPGELDHYMIKEQKFNYFAIEHYIPLEVLNELGALKTTPLSDSKGIYSIIDSKKSILEKKVTDTSDPGFFKHFIPLFECIDHLTGASIEYTS